MVCLNCGKTYKGRYCPHCGQKAATKRLRFTEIAYNFVNSFVGGDNVFLNTCRDLIIRPGYMAQDYLLGKRIRYYNPLQMYVFTLTIYALVSYVLGTAPTFIDNIGPQKLGAEEDLTDVSSAVNFILRCMNELSANKLYGAIFVVLCAILPYRLFFRKYKVKRQDGLLLSLNLTEHFYVLMYHACLLIILSIIMMPLYLINGSETVVSIVSQILAPFYLILIYKQMLRIGWLKSIGLSVLSWLLTFMILIVWIVAVAGLAYFVDWLIA